jgi:LAS superfamily LD-carboxypeptidase LdcB
MSTTQIPMLAYHGFPIHAKILQDVLFLERLAAFKGFVLRPVSVYRSEERQLEIWNAKCAGELPVLDTNSQPLPMESLSEQELVYAILRWSALPGASRHHWGTDMDIYDAAAVSKEYQVQLVPQEYISSSGAQEGSAQSVAPFARMTRWLQSSAKADWRKHGGRAAGKFPFAFPYAQDTGGVAPEPWHVSHVRQARVYKNDLTLAVLQSKIEAMPILCKQTILEHLPDIYERFVT